MIAPKTDAVADLITRMKSETNSTKLGQQFYTIPKRIDDILNNQVFEYYISDRKRQIINPAIEVCISIDGIKFLSMIPSRYRRLQDSRTNVIDLIEYHRIYPFMLFINGRFIPWENIDLIVSYEKYYFMIHDLNDEFIRIVRDVQSLNMIGLPSNVIYSIGVHNAGLTKLFAFNDNGLYDTTDDWSHCIYMNPDEIDVKEFNQPESVIEYTDNPYVNYYNENFFFFQDGLYDSSRSIKIIANYVAISEMPNEGTTCLFIRNPKEIVSIDNWAKVNSTNIKDDIINNISDMTQAPMYLQDLIKGFDFKMDRTKSYVDNRLYALQYIMSYRQDIFVELYEKELDYFSIQVDLEWINNHLNSDGYLSIPRRSSNGKDYYIILIHNGELYKYYKHHFYSANKFNCPITGIESTDTVELLFFKNAVEYSLKNVIKEDDDYLPLNEEYYNNRAKIFCKETSDTYFGFPEDGDQHFPISFSLDKNADGNVKVVFEDSFYYGKEVIITPDNTFKYFGYIMTEDSDIQGYKVSLGTKFNYCNEYDRYLVFHNGRRLNNDDYRLTLPCRSTTPFYRFEIYLTIPLSVDDRIDIFYLPTKIQDINLQIDLPEDGKVTVDKSILPYILDNKTYTFWINGKKIPAKDLKVIDSNTIQLLKDQESTLAFRITAMGEPIDEIENIYQAVNQSLWDKAISETDSYKLLDISKPDITNTEPDSHSGNVPVQSIMLELVREHYMNNEYVDLTGEFIYDYLDVDQSIIDGEDPEGNSIINAADAERRDNLDIERYYP